MGEPRRYPQCAHCGKRIWFDPYGPGWVHFRGTPFCKEPEEAQLAEPDDDEHPSYAELYSLYLGGSWA